MVKVRNDIKVALLCYHANASEIYEAKWIDQYRESIKDQTFQGFEIFEMDYSGKGERIFEHSYFETYKYPTFVHALNYLLAKCFSSGYDFCFNSNCDDWAREDWMEKLLGDIQNGEYDLVSSNFCLVVDDEIIKYHQFDKLNILQELERNHNPVAHPAVCYSKRFYLNNQYVPEEMPREDMLLWLRALRKGHKFHINENNLLYHRIHNNAVCRSENK